MWVTRFIAANLLLLLTTPCIADESYVLTKVFDGDTVELNNISGKFKLRLSDIDAPERNQAYGKKSRRALIKLCRGNNISVNATILGTDKYNRYLGRLQCNRVDASLYLVEHGFAWYNEKYSNDPVIQNAAVMAREKRIGLWRSKKPIPPWVWRQQHPHS